MASRSRLIAKVYRSYLTHVGFGILGLALFALIVEKVVVFGQRWLLKIWGEHDSAYTVTSFTSRVSGPLLYPSLSVDQDDDAAVWLLRYFALHAVYTATSLASTLALYIGSWHAGRLYFRELLSSVVHSTVRWHDTTPRGRILNRMSTDLGTIDNELIFTFSFSGALCPARLPLRSRARSRGRCDVH